MKKGYIVFVLLMIAGLAFTGCASMPQGDLPVITVVNNTGYACYELYLSPVTVDNWEEDVLGNSILPSGQSVRVRLAFPLSRSNRYDFKMVDLDGDTYTKWNVLLTPNATVVFTFSDID